LTHLFAFIPPSLASRGVAARARVQHDVRALHHPLARDLSRAIAHDGRAARRRRARESRAVAM
jgi:hypothetical protein